MNAVLARLAREQEEEGDRVIPISHVTEGGVCWHCWTEGRMVLAFPGEQVPDDGVVAKAADVRCLFNVDGGKVTTAGALRAWATAGACAKCKGTGRTDCPECEGTGEAECSCPDCSGGCACQVCDGAGSDRCDACGGHALGSLDGVYLNRSFLARLVRHAAAEERVSVLTRGPLDAVLFRADGWLAILMPIREETDKPRPAFDGWGE